MSEDSRDGRIRWFYFLGGRREDRLIELRIESSSSGEDRVVVEQDDLEAL